MGDGRNLFDSINQSIGVANLAMLTARIKNTVAATIFAENRSAVCCTLPGKNILMRRTGSSIQRGQMKKMKQCSGSVPINIFTGTTTTCL